MDRNGNVLVVSATAYSVCADPRAVSDEELFLDTIAPVLSLDRETALKKLQDKTKGQIILKRQVHGKRWISCARSKMRRPKRQASAP